MAKRYTREKLRRRLGEIDAALDRYMAELDRADEVVAKTGMHPIEARLSRVMKKLAHRWLGGRGVEKAAIAARLPSVFGSAKWNDRSTFENGHRGLAGTKLAEPALTGVTVAMA